MAKLLVLLLVLVAVVAVGVCDAQRAGKHGKGKVVSGASPSAAAAPSSGATKVITETESVEQEALSDAHIEAVLASGAPDAEDHEDEHPSSDTIETHDIPEEEQHSSAAVVVAGAASSTTMSCPMSPVNRKLCGGPKQGTCDPLTGTCECIAHVTESGSSGGAFFFGSACECGSTKDLCKSPHCYWCEAASSCVLHEEDCGKVSSSHDGVGAVAAAQAEAEASAAATQSGGGGGGGSSSGTIFFFMLVAAAVAAAYYAHSKKLWIFADRSGASYDELQTLDGGLGGGGGGAGGAGGDPLGGNDDDESAYGMREDSWRRGQTYVEVN